MGPQYLPQAIPTEQLKVLSTTQTPGLCMTFEFIEDYVVV